MTSSSQRGQATVEHVAVVALVAVVLAAVGVVASPGLSRLVSDKMAYALCVVGLDVCDTGSARLAGLQPCVTGTEDRERGTSFSLAVFKTGGRDQLLVERRSDGTYRVTTSHDTDLALSGGVGVNLKGVVDLSADVTAGGSFASGTTVEVPDEAALRRLLGDATEDPGAARKLVKRLAGRQGHGVTRYEALEAQAGASAAAGLGYEDDAERGGSVDGLGAEQRVAVRAAVGKATRDGVQTLFYEVPVEGDGPLSDLLPVQGGEVSAAWQRSDPPVLTVTTATSRDGLESVTEARMVLSNPADRALARHWVLSPASVGDLSGRRLRSRLSRRGTMQRFTYDEEDVDEGAWGGEAALGVKLGMDHLASLRRRRLVDAQVLGTGIGGRRTDCLEPANTR